MNTASSAYPDSGWGAGAAFVPNTNFTRAHLGNVGPDGQGVISLRQLSNRSGSFSGGQFGWGWRGRIEAVQPAQGVVRYYRWLFRFSSSTNFRGIDWSNGANADYLSNKMFILGEGGDGNRQRVIVESLESSPRTAGQFRLRLAIDGGETAVYTRNLQVGTWYYVQLEARSGRSSSSIDGRYSLWVNSNSYSSPTVTAGPFVLRTQNWQFVGLGRFVNFGLQEAGTHELHIAAFEAGSAFDPDWSGGGGGGGAAPPAAPSAVRIIQASAGPGMALSGLSVLAAAALRRRSRP
jgi:hypothetical protein